MDLINWVDLAPLAVYALLAAGISYYLAHEDHSLSGLMRSLLAAILAGPTTGVYLASEAYGDSKVFVAVVIIGIFADALMTGLLKIAERFSKNPEQTIKDLKELQ